MEIRVLKRGIKEEEIFWRFRIIKFRYCKYFFKGSDENIITYKSGGIKSKVDYFLVKKLILKECKELKVVPRKSVIIQQ